MGIRHGWIPGITQSLTRSTIIYPPIVALRHISFTSVCQEEMDRVKVPSKFIITSHMMHSTGQKMGKDEVCDDGLL